MDKEFIPYEQALALKELGFDMSCLAYYFSEHYKGKEQKEFRFHIIQHHEIKNPYKHINSDIDFGKWYIQAPTFSQAFRWFREKYGMFSSVWCFETEQKFFIEFGFGIQKFEVNNKEEAELECLKKLIEIVKTK